MTYSDNANYHDHNNENNRKLYMSGSNRISEDTLLILNFMKSIMYV